MADGKAGASRSHQRISHQRGTMSSNTSTRSTPTTLHAGRLDTTGARVEAQVVTASEAEADVPETFALRGNYPNPFNPVTTIAFDLPVASDVRVEVIDLLGRRVLETPVQALGAGTARTLTVDASSLATGVYFYRVLAQAHTRTMVATGRMVLIK